VPLNYAAKAAGGAAASASCAAPNLRGQRTGSRASLLVLLVNYAAEAAGVTAESAEKSCGERTGCWSVTSSSALVAVLRGTISTAAGSIVAAAAGRVALEWCNSSSRGIGRGRGSECRQVV